jgi:hypothetical protein
MIPDVLVFQNTWDHRTTVDLGPQEAIDAADAELSAAAHPSHPQYRANRRILENPNLLLDLRALPEDNPTSG